jgi:hypothetical protein
MPPLQITSLKMAFMSQNLGEEDQKLKKIYING